MLNTYVKTGDPEELRREAQLLRHVAHPDITEVLRVSEGELTLVRVEGTHLDPSNDDLVDSLRRVASALAHLHRRGVAHRRLDASSILVSGPQVTLCRFGGAVPVAHGSEHLFSHDVAAFGRLVESLLPDALQSLRQRHSSKNSADLELLRRVAREARRHDVSAADVVVLLRRSATATGKRRPRRSKHIVTVTVACVTAVTAAVSTVPRQPESSATIPPARQATSGGLIDHAGKPFQLGDVGDEVLSGHWACGRELPVLLQSDDSTLWVYDEWPADGADTGGRLVLDDVVDIEARVIDGCEVVFALQGNGDEVAI